MSSPSAVPPRVTAPLRRIAAAWTWLGLTGYGGPPAHIALLRRLVVERERWLGPGAFEDANAACNLLPGPASTQLAIFCAYRVGGVPGAIVRGLGFIFPSVALILLLSVPFLAHGPPAWVRGAGAGAGAAVAVQAARGLLGPSFTRVRDDRVRAARWLVYLAAGVAAAALIGAYLVLVLLACGLLELALQRTPEPSGAAALHWGAPAALAHAVARSGVLGSLAWTAFKVGALSFGGGFVIIPLMQGDAVNTYHWMTNTQFLGAVALGQITPGPVVATVAAVGYAAHGVLGGLLAAFVAFSPSFSFILLGGERFGRLRENPHPRAFLDGAGPAAIGAILGAAITLAGALQRDWQSVSSRRPRSRSSSCDAAWSRRFSLPGRSASSPLSPARRSPERSSAHPPSPTRAQPARVGSSRARVPRTSSAGRARPVGGVLLGAGD